MRYRLVMLLLLSCGCITLYGRAHPRTPRIRREAYLKHNYFFFSGDNTLQVESYFNYEYAAGSYTTAYPSVLLRYGLPDVLELRIGCDASTVFDKATGVYKTGFAPLQLGAKFRFNRPVPRKHIPAFAITATVVAPHAATESLKQTYWAPTVLVSAEQDITDKLSFEYAAGMQWDPDNFKRGYLGSFNMEYDVTDKAGVYSDFTLFKPESDAADMRVDIGLNATIYKNLHLDVVGGWGLTFASPDYFISAGLQWAFKIKRHGISGAGSVPVK